MKFRITTNGLWFRIEGKRDETSGLLYLFDEQPEWTSVTQFECFDNLPNRFTTYEEAKKVYDFLVADGEPYHFEEVKQPVEKQFTVWYWADHSKINAICAIKHETQFPVSRLWEIAAQISALGLAVMISGDQTVLFVDTKRFTQR